MCELQSSIPRSTIRDKPRHLSRLIQRIIPILFNLLYPRIVILPLFIWCHNVTVSPIGGRPVERIWELDIWRVVGTLQQIQHINLVRWTLNARRNKIIFVQYQVGVGRIFSTSGNFTCTYRTFRIYEYVATCIWT